MKNTIKYIQTIVKILYVISVISAIVCSILAACCILGMIFAKNLYVESQMLSVLDIQVGKIAQYFLGRFHISRYGELLATLSIGVVMSVSQAFFFTYAISVFSSELRTGHPFTTKVAKNIFLLGVLKIVIPLIATLFAILLEVVLSHIWHEEYHFYYGHLHYIGSGFLYIFISLLCFFGAEKIYSIKNEDLSDKN